jgi:uncharacterized protein YjbI with pentapeptide repeats
MRSGLLILEAGPAVSPNDLPNAPPRSHEDLDSERIDLEIARLRRDLSWRATVLEWVKAGTVFAALFAGFVSLYVGHRQVETAQRQLENARAAAEKQEIIIQETQRRQSAEAEENRAADRFDRALARMAERDNPQARISGVAGLKLFLFDGKPKHQKEAVHYLITAVGRETSLDVRQAILDSLDDAVNFYQETKNDALETAIEMDRGITALEARKSLLRSVGEKKASADTKNGPTGSDPQRNLPSFIQRMKLASADLTALFDDPSKDPGNDDNDTLDVYVRIINELLKDGAVNANNNWSNIYCQKCVFPPSTDLRGADFHGALLSGTDFSYTVLRGAHFTNADLGGANFFSADLSGADMSWTDFSNNYAVLNEFRRDDLASDFPYLECSNLSDANLTGLPLLSIHRTFFSFRNGETDAESRISAPKMQRVVGEKIRLDKLAINMRFEFKGDYYDDLDDEMKRKFEKYQLERDSWLPSTVIGSPFNFVRWGSKIALVNSPVGDAIESITRNELVSTQRVVDLSAWSWPLFKSAFVGQFWAEAPITRDIVSIIRKQNTAQPSLRIPAPPNADTGGADPRFGGADPRFDCDQHPPLGNMSIDASMKESPGP